jgi:hypothetical protein
MQKHSLNSNNCSTSLELESRIYDFCLEFLNFPLFNGQATMLKASFKHKFISNCNEACRNYVCKHNKDRYFCIS